MEIVLIFLLIRVTIRFLTTIQQFLRTLTRRQKTRKPQTE